MTSHSNSTSLLDWLAQTVWAPFGLGLLIGLPSALLYLAELILMFRHWHKFDSSFFLLFIVRAVPNMLNFATSYMGQRFGKLGLFMSFYESLPRLVLCFFYFASYYFFHAENLANLFLLLNRLSSIALPMRYNQLWHFLCPLAIAITFLLPLTITIQIFFVNMFLYKSDDGRTFTLNYTYFDGYKDWPIIWRKGNNYMAAGSAVIFTALCLSINMITILLLKYSKNIFQAQQQGSGARKQRVERRMTVYALLSFLGQLLMAGYYISFYWVASYAKYMFDAGTTLRLYVIAVNHYPWVNDIATIALPAWLMLWASERMRRLMGQYCRWLYTWLRTCRPPKNGDFTFGATATAVSPLTRVGNRGGSNFNLQTLRPSVSSSACRLTQTLFGNAELLTLSATNLTSFQPGQQHRQEKCLDERINGINSTNSRRSTGPRKDVKFSGDGSDFAAAPKYAWGSVAEKAK